MFSSHPKPTPDHVEEFFKLYLPLKDRLLRYTVHVSRSSDDGRDLAHDAMIAAYEQFPRLRSPDSLLFVMFKAAIRLHYRRRMKQAIMLRLDTIAPAEAVDLGPGVEDLVDAEVLRLAMLKLPERQRNVVALHHLAGLKFEEIAELDGRSVDAVKKDCSRGRHRLAEILGVGLDDLQSKSSEASVRLKITTVSMRNESDGRAMP